MKADDISTVVQSLKHFDPDVMSINLTSLKTVSDDEIKINLEILIFSHYSIHQTHHFESHINSGKGHSIVNYLVTKRFNLSRLPAVSPSQPFFVNSLSILLLVLQTPLWRKNNSFVPEKHFIFFIEGGLRF